MKRPTYRLNLTNHARSALAKRKLLLTSKSLILLVALMTALTSFGAYKALARSRYYSLFGDTKPQTVDAPDEQPVELGMRFTSARDGWVGGVKFYKSAANTGVHTGTLWSADGEKLANLTFSNETPEGWQKSHFQQPVEIKAGTEYVVSYHTSVGHYAFDKDFFEKAHTSKTSGPLTAPANSDKPNGVFHYGLSGFPAQGYHSSNYYVDVAYSPNRDAFRAGQKSRHARPVRAEPEADPAVPEAVPDASKTPPKRLLAPKPPVSSGAFPNKDNTGVPAGTALKPYTGPSPITEDGTVLDGVIVTDQLSIAAKNVVIKNSRFEVFNDASNYIVYIERGSVTITDSEFTGRGAHLASAIGHDNWTCIRCDVYGMPYDGLKIGSNVTLKDSFVHDFKAGPDDPHADAGQIQNGVTNVNIIHNSLDPSSSDGKILGNAALFIAPDMGPDGAKGPVVIKDNLLGGGNYTIFLNNGDDGKIFMSGFTISNNRFKRNFQYSPFTTTDDMPYTASGNVWDDSGAPLELL